MSSTGMSIMLTLAVATIVSLQLLKDNFTMIENYGDVEGVPSRNRNPNPLKPADFYNNNLINAKPTTDSLKAIGATTVGTPSQSQETYSSYAPANVPTGRADNLSLCAQNMGTFGNGSISSSLLPAEPPKLNGGNMEGFNDVPIENILANQTFFSRQGGGQIGTDTTSGSLRNSNLDIRGELPNPLKYVGEWNLSTIYPDPERRKLN